jgi:hypothetical protein
MAANVPNVAITPENGSRKPITLVRRWNLGIHRVATCR